MLPLHPRLAVKVRKGRKGSGLAGPLALGARGEMSLGQARRRRGVVRSLRRLNRRVQNWLMLRRDALSQVEVDVTGMRWK